MASESNQEKSQGAAGTLVVDEASPQEGPALKGSSWMLLRGGKKLGFGVPGGTRRQKQFFRFLKRAGSDPELLDQIHRLRDAVILSAMRAQPSAGGLTIGLTGVRGGEGTSLLSLLLGLSLGDCVTRRVALLDGQFNIQRFEVLSDVLGLSKDSVAIHKGTDDVVGYYNERYPNLCFLRSGFAEQSMRFFSDRSLSSFLADLRRQFDFTVIDLPPILKEAAGVFALPFMDRLYLVAEAGRSRLVEVERCVETVREGGGQVSGVILNKQRTPLWSRLLWRRFFY